MKKKVQLWMLVTLMLMVIGVACNGDDTDLNEQPDVTEENQVAEDDPGDETDESISVEDNNSEVVITLPASLMEDTDPDEVIAEAEEEGIHVVVNDDGSVTYTMTRAQHNELLGEMAEGIQETIEDLRTSEDFVSIADVTANDSYSEFTMIVDREAYENSFDGFAAFGLGVSGIYYQLFQGVDPDNFQVLVHVQDEETGEVFNTINFPEDLD